MTELFDYWLKCVRVGLAASALAVLALASTLGRKP
jgi:hypothetical protein